MKKKKLKFLFLGSGLLASGLGLSLVLTSCSSVLNEYKDKTLNKGDGLNFYDNTISNGSLADMANHALKSRSGRNEVLAYVNGLISIKLIEKLQEDQKNGNVYKNDLENQKEKIDKEYNDQVDQYKKDHKDGWALKFQQDVLDPVGGTVESYKLDKLMQWANSYINTKVFESFYLSLFDSNDKILKNPSQDQVKQIFSSNGKKLYKFSDQAINSKANTLEGQIFSKIQQIIFDNWVEFENPYVVNMSLWKYGTPKNGISSHYINASDSNTSTDEDGNETTTTNTGSYQFPYFADDNGTNTNPSTVQKFKNFVDGAKTTSNYITDTTNGLKEIPIGHTEDQSTFILVKNGSVYNDLVPEFASASSYLYGTLLSSSSTTTPTADQTTNKGIANQDDKFKKKLNALGSTTTTPSPTANTTQSLVGFDPITSEFISTTENTSFTNQLDLSIEYVNNSLSFNGPLKANRDKKLHIVDGFKVEDTQLNEFMFIRNTYGVHALSIDGSTYLKKATDMYDLKTKAVDVVMYHHFNNLFGFSKDFNIDIKNELTTYYNNNISQNLIEYLFSNDSAIQLDYASFGSDQATVKALLESMISYYTLEKSANRKIDYQKKLISNKKTYSSTNYGQTAPLNGFATPYIFVSKTDDHYDYDFTSLALSTIDKAKKFDESFDEVTKKYNESLTKYYDSVKGDLKPLDSTFEGIKYSQYLYSNNLVINRVLLAYGNSTDITNNIKNEILLKTIKDKYDYKFSRELDTTNKEKYKYTSTYSSKLSSNANLNKGIDQGLSNYFFNKTFTDNDAGRWAYYNMLQDTTTTNKDNNFSVEKLNTYRNRLWSYSAEYVNNNTSTSMNELYSLLISINYLLENDYSEFINYLKDTITLSNNAFLVWSNSYNFEIEDKQTTTTNPPSQKADAATKPKTIDELLDVKNMKQNLNNSFSSNYFGFTNVSEVTNNTYNDATYNTNENYYTVAGSRLGFYGLQIQNSAALPTTMGDLLFNDPLKQNADGTGILYSYGNKENLIKYVNELSTINAIDTLANNLFKYTGTFVKDNVVNQKGLDAKKQAFVNNINDANQIKDQFFKPRNSQIGLEKTTTNNGTTTKTYEPIIDSENSRVKHGGYAIQLNYENIKDFNTLYTYIKTNLGTTNTNGTNNETDAYNVIGNLIVRVAMDSNIQKRAVDKVISQNKINVYDIRLYNALGSAYIKNWKW